jgi:hypothetical protein
MTAGANDVNAPLDREAEITTILMNWPGRFDWNEEQAKHIVTSELLRQWLGGALDTEALPRGPLSPCAPVSGECAVASARRSRYRRTPHHGGRQENCCIASLCSSRDPAEGQAAAPRKGKPPMFPRNRPVMPRTGPNSSGQGRNGMPTAVITPRPPRCRREAFAQQVVIVSNIEIYLHCLHCTSTAARTRDLLLRRHFEACLDGAGCSPTCHSTRVITAGSDLAWPRLYSVECCLCRAMASAWRGF